MERVWRRVQGAGRRGAAARCGCPVQPCQLHVDQRAKRGGGGRKSRGGGPQTIVCGCQVQPCPVHPVLIRIRRTRPAAASAAAAAAVTSCDCPPDSQPCPHLQRGSAARRIRRSECTDRSCRHTSCGTRRRAAVQSSSSPVSSQLQLQQQPCECTDERLNRFHTGGGEAPCECECGEEAMPCPHTAKTRSVRRTCTDCSCTQPCGHKPQSEGRIKRVKCRVRRAGCAMARCTAELAMLHLHWELAAECAPCRPRALTRRLCRRQQSDNELYRSNSFKFERFERTKDECVTPLRKQVSDIICGFFCSPHRPLERRSRVIGDIAPVCSTFSRCPVCTGLSQRPGPRSCISPAKVSLCDDYSLPVDFVNKRRPASAAAATSTVQWTLPSPTVENAEVEVVEQYSDPRDSKSKAYVEPGAESSLPTIYSRANRNYCRPYTDPSASGSSCEDDEEGRLVSVRKRKNSVYASSTRAQSADRDTLTSTDGLLVDCVALVHLTDQSPTESNQPVRHPSPYYYGDLFKVPEQLPKSQPNKYRKSVSLDVPGERSRTPGIPKRNSVAGDGGSYSSQPRHYQQQQQPPPPPPPPLHYRSQDLVSPTSGSEHAVPARGEILSSCIITEWDHTLMPPHRLLSHDLPTAVCTCVASPEEEEDELEGRQPQVTRHQVRKLRRTRRIDPQPILVEDEDDVEGEDEGEEEEEEDVELEDEDEEGMARQRHLYETAFDCKVNRSDDDLDDLDRITNHAVLHSQVRSGSAALTSRTSSSTDTSKQQHVQPLPYTGQSQSSKDHRRKVVLLRPKPIPSRLQQQQQQQQQQSDNISTLSQDIESLQINSSDEKTGSPRLPARDYTPSPPSTAPLPAKFHGNRDHLLLNIRSAPNLPSQPDHPRLKDMRLPVKSLLRAKDSPQSSEGSILEIKSRPKTFVQENIDSSQSRRFDKELILEFKDRPREERQRPRSLIRESRPIMEFKGRPHEAESDLARPARRDAGLLEFKLRTSRRRVGYSSTESMATSSSGGSMESIRSSTSEGNRSTSSSDSRHSTRSLSSHSSDSGGSNCYHHQHQPSLSGFLTHHATKLHILSPISDKSSQEPASETSDNNRNNNSQKASPEENIITENNVTAGNNTNAANTNAVTSPMDTSFKKRRTPQNKNLINLALQSSSSGDAEIQGSDSGISIESRAGIKCKPFGFHLLKPQLDNINLVDNEPELSDLPFDMPKLRRRRLLMQQDATTSGSATSVDLRDLPFDMPKLRKRLRCTQSIESSASQASSSLSVRDVEPPPLFGGGLSRPKMTLNLDAGGNAAGTSGIPCGGLLAPKKPGGLSLGLPLEISTARISADLVDVELPLERQGWYHGSITRIEAEGLLRVHQEGSYLVRNSESTKQDYSLSLKSARGFMHMRIQKNEELNAYILGQFSKPFENIPEMVRHFSVNRLPIRGAEHMCLLHPVIVQLL